MITEHLAAPEVESGGSVAAARRHRAEVLHAMHAFRREVAAPAADPQWRDRVAGRLAELRTVLTEHIVLTEGPGGLYAELRAHAPRLAHGVAGLVAEHGTLLARLDALARQLRGADLEMEDVRRAARRLLAELSQHRQRGADLVYEAYATDIGGET